MIYDYLNIGMGCLDHTNLFFYLSPRLRHPESHLNWSQKKRFYKQRYPHFGLAPSLIYLMGIFKIISIELLE